MLLNNDFFDTVQDRHMPGDIKYRSTFQYDNLIPMWIADMDFRSPPSVDEAIRGTVRNGIYGYHTTDDEYEELLCRWYAKRMNWHISPEWLLKTPNVMFSIAVAIRALSNEGESIMICQPVYYPFAKIILTNKRKLIISELQWNELRYEMDFDDIEKKIMEHSVKVFLLCSPHNPVGRVWTMQELTNLGRICQKNNVYIISDEIHSDFVFEGNRHLPISVLSEELAQRTVTCISPTKTFNLAGIGGASAVIPNAVLRKKVQKECVATGFGDLNMMAIAAATAAYRDGELWLDTLLSYLENNIRILREFCAGGPIRLIQPEGTYLMWLDCRMLSPKVPDAGEYFFQHAHVQLHKGKVFGIGGDGFVRMNIACPRAVLREALYRMGEAIRKIH